MDEDPEFCYVSRFTHHVLRSVMRRSNQKMPNFFPKSIYIQILLSLLLILFGVVVIYQIHRARSGSEQSAFRNHSDGSDIIESEQAGSMSYASPPDGEDEPQITEEQRRASVPEPTQTESGNRDLAKESADLAERLEKLTYEGYMQIGDLRLAWVSDGKNRMAVGKGGLLDNTIRVDEIHENFLLVSTADGHVTQEIPFTQNPDQQSPVPPSSAVVTARNTNISSRVTAPQSASTTAPESKSVDTSSDRYLPPSSGYMPPPMPGQNPTPRDDNASYRVSNNAGTTIYTDSGPKAAKSVGETFAVQVKIDNGSDIFAVPFDIRYDPAILEVVGLYESTYLKKGGGQTTFLTSINRDKGNITVGLTRLGRIGGVSGSGTLMSVTFRALKRGSAFLSFANGKPMDSKMNVLPVKFVRGRIRVE